MNVIGTMACAVGTTLYGTPMDSPCHMRDANPLVTWSPAPMPFT